MKRFFVIWLVIIIIAIVGVAYSWLNYPAWRDPSTGGFWALVIITFTAVWKGVREVIGLWNDVNKRDETSIVQQVVSSPDNHIQAGHIEIHEHSRYQSVNEQHGENIFNLPGGTLTFNQDKSNKISDMSPPSLELRFIDKLGRYLDQIILEQTIPNQKFSFQFGANKQ